MLAYNDVVAICVLIKYYGLILQQHTLTDGNIIPGCSGACLPQHFPLCCSECGLGRGQQRLDGCSRVWGNES